MGFTLYFIVNILLGILASQYVIVDLHTVVLPPIHSKSDEAALISIPAEHISGEAYHHLCVAIQKSTPLKLWIGLATGFPSDVPNLVDVQTAIDLAIKDLKEAGLSTSAPIFVAGHSKGGVFAQSAIASDPSRFAGLLLWASYLTGGNDDLGAFPTPVLTVSGDLDGITRITRIGRTFRSLSNLVASNPSTIFTKPVTLISDVNHSHFASGQMPQYIIENDIPSNLTQLEAQNLIAKMCSLFMVVNIDPMADDAKAMLQGAVLWTNQTLLPLLTAHDYEGLGDTSKWARVTQDMVANVPASYQSSFRIRSHIYTNEDDFVESKPSVVKDDQGTVLATTNAYIYETSNPSDDPLIEESAYQMAVKTKNQKAVQRVLGDGKYGQMKLCQEINQEALTWALQRASSVARQRYTSLGRDMMFDKDKAKPTGSQWVSSNVEYKYTSEGDLVVTSTSLYTDPDFIIPDLAGMYYCKQLSPYRAMEWIYVDSLKPYNPQI